MFFLRAKPWVIFTLLIIVPIVGFILMALMAKVIGSNGLIPLGTVMAFIPCVITYIGWFWNAGSQLIQNPQSKSVFKRCYLTVVIIAFLGVPALRVIFNDDMAVVPDGIGVLNFIGALYCIYLIRNGLHERETEMGKLPASKTKDFFLIWLLPIGIWFTQRRIQRVLNNNSSF